MNSALPTLCRPDCADCYGPPAQNGGVADFSGEYGDEADLVRTPGRQQPGLVTYSVDTQMQLLAPAQRSGEVRYLCAGEDMKDFQQATLALHANGLRIKPLDTTVAPFSIVWSPFSLVQACRLASIEDDMAAHPWLRIFKVSVFHHGITYIFATEGDQADTDRIRWVADISRALRVLTQSLIPCFRLRVEPLVGASWTATRLLAGYLLLYDELGVSLVYSELHCHFNATALFTVYVDEYCDIEVMTIVIKPCTVVTERMGVDCSCFSVGDFHFTGRTCSEKNLWLRAVSNVKVKLRHWAPNPSDSDIRNFRAAIFQHIMQLPRTSDGNSPADGPLLPRLPHQEAVTQPVPALGAPCAGCGPDGPGSPGFQGPAVSYTGPAAPMPLARQTALQRTPEVK